MYSPSRSAGQRTIPWPRASRAAATARPLGYSPLILPACLRCEAREAGVFLANMVRYQRTAGRRIALIAGGETVVHLSG